MAQTIKLKRSATQGATPTTSQLALGEVAINTYDGKLYIKKDVGGTESIVEIGSGGGDAADIVQEYQYTATASQTTFSGSDDNNQILAYSSGALQVFLNGVLLDLSTDYTATNGTSVVLTNAASAGDFLQLFSFKKKFSDSNVSVNTFTGDNSTTAFTLTSDPGAENNTRVFIDGVYQSKNNYSVSGTTLTFSTAPPSNTEIEVEMGVRSITVDDVDNLDLNYLDNEKLFFGAGQNLGLFYNGTNSVINHAGTGDLLIQKDGNTKLTPTSTGIDVTGTISADGFSIAGDISFYNSLGTSQDFFWDASESRLGLGTTSPDAFLDIESAGHQGEIALKLTDRQAESASSQNYNINMITKYAEEQFTLYNTDTYRNMSWIGFDNYGQEITFGTGQASSGAQRMVIDRDGNVGIGLSNPDKMLVVRGSGAEIVIDDTNTTDTPRLRFRESGTTSASIRTDASNLIFDAGTSEAMRINSSGVTTFKGGTAEQSNTITSSSGAATLDLTDGDNFIHDLTENVTYTFSNPAASGSVSAFTLKVIQGATARTITWPTSVDWAGGTAPTLSTGDDDVDVFVFFTHDGGTTYYGFTAGQDMS